MKLSILLLPLLSVISDAKTVSKRQGCPDHEIVIYNGCPFSIWPAVFSPIHRQANNGFKLDPYQSRSFRVPCKWTAGRIWARTLCDGSGRNCETGDCNQMQCQGAGVGDVSLAEFTLDGGNVQPMGAGDDVYDISAVDAYNLPLHIAPVNGVKIGQQFGLPAEYDCIKTECKFDFRNNCPDELKKWVNGKVASCLSACTKFNTDALCCRGQYNQPQTCKAQESPFVRYFKDRCKQMYSYAFDDPKSTFHCKGYKGTKYVVSFCP